MELNKILKVSNWRNGYQQAFTDADAETESILKSEGVDTDSGFLFSVDTMQAFFITKKNPMKYSPKNSFLVKVHKPGDLPWVKDDKSTWTRISSNQFEMVTYFISIKGEKVINTVS